MSIVSAFLWSTSAVVALLALTWLTCKVVPPRDACGRCGARPAEPGDRYCRECRRREYTPCRW